MLDNINLLPWRDMARQRYKHQFIAGLIGVVALAVIFGGVYGAWIDWQIAEQRQRVITLNRHLSVLQTEQQHHHRRELRYQQQHQRLMTFQDLYYRQYAPLRLMMLLTEVVMEGVSLERVELNHNRVVLAGLSLTTQQLTQTVSLLENNPEISTLKIHDIERDSGRFDVPFARFELSFYLLPPVTALEGLNE